MILFKSSHTTSKRNLLLLIPLLLMLLFVFKMNKANIKKNNIAGIWEGYYNNKKISILFESNNKCTINQDSNKKDINGIYSLDYNKEIIQLSIKNINELNHSLYTILKFKNKNTMQISRFSTKWKLRPIVFNNKNIITLKRKKGIKNGINI